MNRISESVGLLFDSTEFRGTHKGMFTQYPVRWLGFRQLTSVSDLVSYLGTNFRFVHLHCPWAVRIINKHSKTAAITFIALANEFRKPRLRSV